MMLGPRFREALDLAMNVHEAQCRKGKDVPYLAHLLAVASLVLEDGGDEEQAIAALLHDSLEDHGDVVSEGMLEARFGRRVREIVAGCTDTPPGFTGCKKPPWRQRKEAYLAHLRDVSVAARRVSLADKLHNACDLLADMRPDGPDVLKRFNGDQLWWYRSLLDRFLTLGPPGRLLVAFEEVVNRLEAFGAAEQPPR